MDKEHFPLSKDDKVFRCPTTGLSGVLDLETAKHILSGWLEVAVAAFYGPDPEEEIKGAFRRLIEGMKEVKPTRVAVKNPACHKCGNPTVRMRIFEPLPDGSPDRTRFEPGWRCTVCRDVARYNWLDFKFKIDACCAQFKEAAVDEESISGGIEVDYHEEEGILKWWIGDDEFSLSDILFCPFCGARLPERPESVEGLEEAKP